MRLRFILTGVLVSCFALCAISGAVAKPAGEGAFLTDYATSVSDVVKQVEGNRLLALRYAKHFRTDPSSVVAFLRNELTISTFTEDSTMTVYHLDSSRNIASKSVQFKRGAQVFSNKNGLPILEYGTGNPLSTELTIGGNIKSLSASEATGPDTVVSQVLDQAPVELSPTAPAEATGAVAPSAGQAGAGETGTLVAASLPGVTSGEVIGAAARSAASSSPSWILPAGLLGAAALFAGGNTSSTTPIATPPLTDPADDSGPPLNNDPIDSFPDENIIPEPTSMIVLGTGAAGLFGFVIRRRRS